MSLLCHIKGIPDDLTYRGPHIHPYMHAPRCGFKTFIISLTNIWSISVNRPPRLRWRWVLCNPEAPISHSINSVHWISFRTLERLGSHRCLMAISNARPCGSRTLPYTCSRTLNIFQQRIRSASLPSESTTEIRGDIPYYASPPYNSTSVLFWSLPSSVMPKTWIPILLNLEQSIGIIKSLSISCEFISNQNCHRFTRQSFIVR